MQTLYLCYGLVRNKTLRTCLSVCGSLLVGDKKLFCNFAEHFELVVQLQSVVEATLRFHKMQMLKGMKKLKSNLWTKKLKVTAKMISTILSCKILLSDQIHLKYNHFDRTGGVTTRFTSLHFQVTFAHFIKLFFPRPQSHKFYGSSEKM